MSLRVKAFLALILVTALYVSSVFIVINSVITAKATELEKQLATNINNNAHKIIEKRIDNLSTVLRDYAVWDDTYVYVQEPNDDYISSNFIQETFNINNIDIVAIINNTNQVIFQQAYIKDDKITQNHISTILNRIDALKNSVQKYHLIVEGGTIWMFDVHEITTSDAQSPSIGKMVMVRQITEAEKNIINDQVGQKVEWLVDLPKNNSIQINDQFTIVNSNLKDISPDNIYLELYVPRTYSYIVSETRNSVALTILIPTFLTLLIGLWFLEHFGLGPLLRIVAEVQNIDTFAMTTPHIPVKSNDEFGFLSAQINKMLSKLKKSHDQLLFAQTEIAKQRVLEEKKDEFFIIASHELRTPLTAIRGNIEYLHTAYQPVLKSVPELASSLDDMHTASMRLLNLVNDFLTTAKIDQNQLTPVISTFPLSEAISTPLRELQNIAENHQIKFEYTPNTPDILVNADYQFLYEIIQNLVNNSIKFTPKFGTIKVYCYTKQEQVFIAVSDTGKGIPESERESLFQRFHQVNSDPITHDTTQGSGLGLYICKKLANTMRSDVLLQQSEVGKGSTFVIVVPLAKTI